MTPGYIMLAYILRCQSVIWAYKPTLYSSCNKHVLQLCANCA